MVVTVVDVLLLWRLIMAAGLNSLAESVSMSHSTSCLDLVSAYEYEQCKYENPTQLYLVQYNMYMYMMYECTSNLKLYTLVPHNMNIRSGQGHSIH